MNSRKARVVGVVWGIMGVVLGVCGECKEISGH